MSLPHCGAHSFQPSQPTLRHIPTCFCRFSFFRFLFKLLSTTAEQQIPYGEHTQLLLQLMVLQSFKEGRLLGVLTKVLDIDTVFPSSVSDAKAIADAKAQYLLSNKAFWAAFDGLFASVCTGTW